MPKKTRTTITIQGIHVTSNDPAVMASAMRLAGALIGAALGPTDPPVEEQPQPKRIAAPRRGNTREGS